MLLDGNIELLEEILKKLPANIFYKDKMCRYQFSTHYWRHLKQEGENWSIQGKTDLDVQRDKELGTFYYEDDIKILATGEGSRYISEIDLDGIVEYLEIIKEPVKDSEGNIVGIVGLINDVTEKVILERELKVRAGTDILTGFHNRRYLDEWVRAHLSDAIYPVSIISADCDGLKRINDVYGHHAGDELIKIAASLFRIIFPDTTMMFRVGGDEFVFIVPGTTEEEGKELIDKLQNAAKTIRLKGKALAVSYGLCVMDSKNSNFNECLDIADKAMYENKVARKKAEAEREAAEAAEQAEKAAAEEIVKE